MEISTNSGSNIELTVEAKTVIIHLARLDAIHRLEKVKLFEQLYQLWKWMVLYQISKASRCILGKPTQQYDMHSLNSPTGELVMEPQVVHDSHVKHGTEWMGGNGIETFFDKYTIDWTQPQMLWPQFQDFPAHQNIPADLVQRIWEAIVLPARNCLGLRERIAVALS